MSLSTGSPLRRAFGLDPPPVDRANSTSSVTDSNKSPRINFLAQHLLNLFDEGKECDVLFQLDDGEIVGAHKLILISVEFFRRMLGGNFREGTKDEPIRLSGLTAREMRLVFRYIYTGNLEESLTHKMALRLLRLSQMWLFSNLRRSVVEWALGNLDKKTCILTFVNVSNVLLSSPEEKAMIRIPPERSVASKGARLFRAMSASSSYSRSKPALEATLDEGSQMSEYERFLKRYRSFLQTLATRDFRKAIREQANELARISDYRALEAFAALVSKRAYKEDEGMGKTSFVRRRGREAGTFAASSEEKECPTSQGSILKALFDAVVKYFKVSSDAIFVRETMYNILPRLKSNERKKTAATTETAFSPGESGKGGEEGGTGEQASEICTTDKYTLAVATQSIAAARSRNSGQISGASTSSASSSGYHQSSHFRNGDDDGGESNSYGEGEGGGHTNNNSHRQSDGGRDMKGEAATGILGRADNDGSPASSPSPSTLPSDPVHIYLLELKKDFKTASSGSFSIGDSGIDAQFYIDCQMETRDRYRGWHGIYLCPDWPEPTTPDMPLTFEALPTLVSFRLTLTASDRTLWKYSSDPIVFLASDTGWGQCRAVRSAELRKQRSAVVNCYAQTSAVFRMCIAHLYRNFESIDPEVIAGLDPRTMRCMIVSKWPAVKGGRMESRLDAMCGNLSRKAEEWSKLRTKVHAQEEEILRLRRKLQGRGDDIGFFKRRNRLQTAAEESSVAMSEVTLPFGRMFIPTKTLGRKEEKGDFAVVASGSSVQGAKEAIVGNEEEKKEKRTGSLEGLISTPGGLFT